MDPRDVIVKARRLNNCAADLLAVLQEAQANGVDLANLPIYAMSTGLQMQAAVVRERDDRGEHFRLNIV